MKILQVHNRYNQRGGEDVVFDQEFRLLKKEFEVGRYIADNRKEINGIRSKLRLLLTTHYSRRSMKRIRQELLDRDYDLMHVHNFFPLLTPSIFDASKELGIPSVMTLHNYRLVHPNGLLLCNGKIDERPVRGSAYQCVKDRVYRNSLIQTAVVSHMIEYHRKKKTWHEKVDRFLCLSNFARKKFIEAGLPAEKIRIKPNFAPDILEGEYSSQLAENKEDYYLFVGRVSQEKGVKTLVKAWKKMKGRGLRLLIAGDGPLKWQLEQETEELKEVEWLGILEREQVLDYLAKAKALILPSECYEGMPMTIIEAFSVGTMVVTTDIGSQEEIVVDKLEGLHFRAGDPEDLIDRIEVIEDDLSLIKKLGINAREKYEHKYTPERNLQYLKEIYGELMG